MKTNNLEDGDINNESNQWKLTTEEIRSIPDFANISDEESKEVTDSLVLLCKAALKYKNNNIQR